MLTTLKVVYFGTPSFSAELLAYLLDHSVQCAAIVTQPDRPKGRGLKETVSPVKALVQKQSLSLPILQPLKASDPYFLEHLKQVKADLFVVVAFGQILPQKLLDLAPLGCINVHASLLPKYRGAAPIQRSIMNGDAQTGISIQKMVFQLDAGDVIAEEKIRIFPNETHGELEHRLCDLAKPLLLKVIQEYSNQIPQGQPQDASQVVFAPKISSDDRWIDWRQQAQSIHNQIRGLSPRPGAVCLVEIGSERKQLKILKTELLDSSREPGQLVSFNADACVVSAQNGSLALLEVQLEGKKRMSIKEWIRGCRSPPIFLLKAL